MEKASESRLPIPSDDADSRPVTPDAIIPVALTDRETETSLTLTFRFGSSGPSIEPIPLDAPVPTEKPATIVVGNQVYPLIDVDEERSAELLVKHQQNREALEDLRHNDTDLIRVRRAQITYSPLQTRLGPHFAVIEQSTVVSSGGVRHTGATIMVTGKTLDLMSIEELEHRVGQFNLKGDDGSLVGFTARGIMSIEHMDAAINEWRTNYLDPSPGPGPYS